MIYSAYRVAAEGEGSGNPQGHRLLTKLTAELNRQRLDWSDVTAESPKGKDAHMIELDIHPVEGPWIGNDYGGPNKDPKKSEPNVTMAKVSVGPKIVALVFMTHMNIDYDGAPKAYGPPNWSSAGLKEAPLDTLANAGKGSGYYGLVAVHPKTRSSNVGFAAPPNVQLDPAQPDPLGRCPVIQQKGDSAEGYYVSASALSTGVGTAFEQKHYVDSSAVPFQALSYRFGLLGVRGGDFGLALRHDTYRTAGYSIMAGEGHKAGSGKKEWALGECSYRVFTDIGGQPRSQGAFYVNNNFPTSFVVFPGSSKSALPWISMASNSIDFAVFLALLAEADRIKRGPSAIPAFRKYVHAGRTTMPAATQRIMNALTPYGYAPILSVVGAVVGALV